MQEKTAELLALKEKIEDVGQECLDTMAENNLKQQTDEYQTVENLKTWIRFFMGKVDTEMEKLKDIVGLVTGNVTSKTYRGELKLHLELMKKFDDVTYAWGDLDARVKKLQTKFIELGKCLF